jgi:ABC-type polysaccharide/polyol phosphate export permease
MDLRARYRGSALGLGWSLLHPIAMTTIICTVFCVLFKQDLRTYAPFVFSGMTFWGFFAAVAVQGCQCFFDGESYIRQFPAPMAIYPLRTVLGSAIHFSIGLLLATALACWVGPRGASREMQLLALFSLVPTFALLLLFGWSVAVLFGLLNVRFRDTRHLAEVGLQGLFYMTPIMYDPKYGTGDWKGRDKLTLMLDCNPLTPFLRLLREPLLNGHAPSLTMYAFAGMTVLILVTMAVFALKSEERRLIFYL